MQNVKHLQNQGRDQILALGLFGFWILQISPKKKPEEKTCFMLEKEKTKPTLVHNLLPSLFEGHHYNLSGRS